MNRFRSVCEDVQDKEIENQWDKQLTQVYVENGPLHLCAQEIVVD